MSGLEADTDESFLGYVDLHSRTDLALFHQGHVQRFVRLAGAESVAQWDRRRDFVAMHHYDIAPLLKEAYVRLRARPYQPLDGGHR